MGPVRPSNHSGLDFVKLLGFLVLVSFAQIPLHGQAVPENGAVFRTGNCAIRPDSVGHFLPFPSAEDSYVLDVNVNGRWIALGLDESSKKIIRITKQTKFGNCTGLDNLEPADAVNVVFVEDAESNRIALSITKAIPTGIGDISTGKITLSNSRTLGEFRCSVYGIESNESDKFLRTSNGCPQPILLVPSTKWLGIRSEAEILPDHEIYIHLLERTVITNQHGRAIAFVPDAIEVENPDGPLSSPGKLTCEERVGECLSLNRFPLPIYVDTETVFGRDLSVDEPISVVLSRKSDGRWHVQRVELDVLLIGKSIINWGFPGFFEWHDTAGQVWPSLDRNLTVSEVEIVHSTKAKYRRRKWILWITFGIGLIARDHFIEVNLSDARGVTPESCKFEIGKEQWGRTKRAIKLYGFKKVVGS
ncbi:MAG: hypothetical protein L0338_06435 [Acidobacteria bacterium]|nr:hypothetical protein [Acidobacteriota bacterium]